MSSLPFPGESPYPRKLTLWEPAGPPRAVILLAHGMAEHIARYERLAGYLRDAGFLVAGYNHLGHGAEAPIKGWFGEKGGWWQAVSDLHAAMAWLSERAPDKPRILLGHSMGSFMSREYALRYPDALDGLILSGTGWYPKSVCMAGLLPARLLCALGQSKKGSKLLDKLSFSSNNKAFKAKDGTPFDWLSRDKAEVKKYVNDPVCGFVFTAGGFRDFFTGLLALTDVDRLHNLPKGLPVCLISGEADPVGTLGVGVRTVADQYRQAGLKDVDVKLYENARHEMFNEINRDQAMKDLGDWLNSHT